MIFISITKFLRIKYNKLHFGDHWANILFYNEHALQETNGMYTVSRITTEIIPNLTIPLVINWRSIVHVSWKQVVPYLTSILT